MQRCPKNTTGSLPTLTPISTASALWRSRGNSCAATTNIGKPIGLSSVKPKQARNSPNRSPSAGGCDFAVDPDQRADRARVVWLPHLNPTTVVVAPAPAKFREARPFGGLTSSFSRRAVDGEYWLVESGNEALPVTLLDGVNTSLPAAIVLPLDGSFGTRAEAGLRLWRIMTGRARGRPPDDLTAQQRGRLRLALRGLDGRLAGCSYRAIAQVLFGQSWVPSGPDWKTHEVRDRTIRLCRRGRDLMRGGYLSLLRTPRRFRS
jgi:hypothetical protein